MIYIDFLWLELHKVLDLLSSAWVTATTGQPYLITNKRVAPSVRYRTFSTKQTAIPATQTLALLSIGGTYFFRLNSGSFSGFNFSDTGQGSSWSKDNFVMKAAEIQLLSQTV